MITINSIKIDYNKPDELKDFEYRDENGNTWFVRDAYVSSVIYEYDTSVILTEEIKFITERVGSKCQ